MKNLLNLGSVLSKAEQQSIAGGGGRSGMICCEWESEYNWETGQVDSGPCIEWAPAASSCSFSA